MISTARFTGWLGLAWALLAGLAWLLVPTIGEAPPNAAIWAVGAITWGALLTGIVFALNNRTLLGRAAAFTTTLMATSMAKMVLSALGLLAVALIQPAVLSLVVGAYFTAYFVLTGLEVTVLLRNLRAGQAAGK